MGLLNDPSMKEVVDEFCIESLELCDELEEILDLYSDDLSQVALLEKFGQIIDRIMGAAKSVGAQRVGTVAELGKTISYKASQTNDEELLNIVSAVLYDSVEYIQKAIEGIKKNQDDIASGLNEEAFKKRLKWLAEKFSNIQRSSVAVGDIDSLLKKLQF